MVSFDRDVYVYVIGSELRGAEQSMAELREMDGASGPTELKPKRKRRRWFGFLENQNKT